MPPSPGAPELAPLHNVASAASALPAAWHVKKIKTRTQEQQLFKACPAAWSPSQGLWDVVLIPLPGLGFIIFPSIVQSPLYSLHARPPGPGEAVWFSCAQTWLVASSRAPFCLSDTISGPKRDDPCSFQPWRLTAIR